MIQKGITNADLILLSTHISNPQGPEELDYIVRILNSFPKDFKIDNYVYGNGLHGIFNHEISNNEQIQDLSTFTLVSSKFETKFYEKDDKLTELCCDKGIKNVDKLGILANIEFDINNKEEFEKAELIADQLLKEIKSLEQNGEFYKVEKCVEQTNEIFQANKEQKISNDIYRYL